MLKKIKNLFVRLFGRKHTNISPLSIKLEDQTDLEVKSSIYTLHDSFRLEFIKSYNNLVDDLRQNRITQAQFDQKYAELNTAIIAILETIFCLRHSVGLIEMDSLFQSV